MLNWLVIIVLLSSVVDSLVHKHGIIQFINVYKKYMDRCCDELRWGDEVGEVV